MLAIIGGSDLASLSAPPPRFLNRELSWLDFNARVLAQAEDASLPILERCRFVAIFAGNLDEFFQVRVARLREQIASGLAGATPDGMTQPEQLQAIRSHCERLVGRAVELFSTQILPSLEKAGIRLTEVSDLTEEDVLFLSREFRRLIFPILTPLAVDPSHPFPYISSLSLNLGVSVRNPVTGLRRFARVEVPPRLPRFIALPDGERFVPMEVLIAAHLDQLFPGMEILAHHVFRVTRDANVDLDEDEADGLVVAIESVIRRRRDGTPTVRLEVDAGMSDEMRALLLRELGLDMNDVYVAGRLVDLTVLWDLYALDRPDLKPDPWNPVTQPRLIEHKETRDLFAVLRRGDVLVQHPYDSFTTSVEAIVEQAAADPAVVAIKQTLYRISAQESDIIRSLVHAAEIGKQVVVLVELKARFDEEANITLARALEEAGAHVVFGVVGLKTHAKILLVVRREADGLRRYAHVGTGNYNPVTANFYEDVGLLSADPDLGADLTDLFNALSGYSRQREYRKLLVAPHSLRSRVLDLIHRETRQGDGSIVCKMNSLVDPDVIDAFYGASQAGCSIDLVVRGICCLRPGVPGLSETVRVRSIVGGYLEHSRLFRFGSERRGFDHYIGSADLMPRNLDRRIEAMVPITDPDLKARLDEVLHVLLTDDSLAWQLDGDGKWTRLAGDRVNSQLRLQELATLRAQSTG